MTTRLIEMITVSAGSIDLRDDRVGRKWRVDLAPFEIGSTAVTQEQYRAVTGLAPSVRQGERLPVESVSWLDAVRFCNQLSEREGLAPVYRLRDDGADRDPDASGYRLPSEAEWEFACRAGTSGPRHGALDAIAWYAGNSGGGTREVAGKEPNAWGLFDMLGNVWEWCDDIYDPEVYGVYRVFRGGGWADEERGVLATNRRRSHPTFAIDDLGFRVSRSL